jgi:alkylation response protein AidB-like acyl-CoA dehydrogenase
VAERFYQARVRALFQAGPSEPFELVRPQGLSVMMAATEYCLAFREFRRVSLQGPGERPEGWSIELRDIQARMDAAWAAFDRAAKKCDDVLADPKPPEPTSMFEMTKAKVAAKRAAKRASKRR